MEVSEIDVQYKWDELHSSIFSQLIEVMSANGIRYFLLRNYDGLPEQNAGKDVDIVIEPGSYLLCSDLFRGVLRSNGVSNYTITKFDRMRCWYVMDLALNFALHIDFIEGYLYKGIEFFSFDELYQNTDSSRGMTVLKPAHDAVMLLAQNVVAYGVLKQKYQDIITNLYVDHADEIDSLLTSMFGGKCGTHLVSLLKQNDYNSIVSMAATLRGTLWLRKFCKAPGETLYRCFRFFIEKVYRVAWCPSKFQRSIAVLGPDGSGKTSFLNLLISRLSYLYVSNPNRFNVRHFRPTLFPNLGAVGEKAKVMKQDIDFTEPHRAKPAGFISSFFRMGYYWTDYVVGGACFLRKDVQFERYTIYDRYIYDFLVDPHRSRINLPYWLRKMFTRLVQQPRIVFVLLTDAETIYARKQELTKPEIERQLGELNKLAQSHKRFIILNASKSSEEIVADAVSHILREFTEQV